jgi:hypothetical protein
VLYEEPKEYYCKNTKAVWVQLEKIIPQSYKYERVLYWYPKIT